VETLTPDRERCAELLNASWAFAVSYVPLLGYETVSRIIAEYRDKSDASEQIRQALEYAQERALEAHAP
jgi:aspartate ammonia-lyase